MSRDEAVLHLELARERLVVARELLEADHLRDATSRAYYAVFHAAHALARTKDLDPRTHRGLGQVLAEHFTGPGLLTEEDLSHVREAQRLREVSDYEPGYEPVHEDVEELVAYARSFVDRVEQILG